MYNTVFEIKNVCLGKLYFRSQKADLLSKKVNYCIMIKEIP